MFHQYFMSRSGQVYPNKLHDADVPVVVISPEDREQVERLHRLRDAAPGFGVERTQAALREYADPKPPKPVEPTGLGAVVDAVVDGQNSVRLVRDGDIAGNAGPGSRDEHPWRQVRADGIHCRNNWADLLAVTVLSEGVTP